jgi:hypothetical protein
VFPLNLPLHEPQPHLAWRTPPAHHILHVGHEARDMRPGDADDPSTGMIDRDDYLAAGGGDQVAAGQPLGAVAA